MKKTMPLFLLIIILACNSSIAQDSTPYPKSIPFEQLDAALQLEEKPILIFVHTSWCTYCNAMKQSTLQDTALLNLINDAFYYVSFNAESKEDITFRNTTFSYKSNGSNTGTHQLATALLSTSKEKSYPVTIVMNKNLEILFEYSGFLDENEMLHILTQIKNRIAFND